MTFKPIAFVAMALIVVAALWFFFKPQRPELQAPDSAKPVASDAPAATSVPAGTPGPVAPSPSGSHDVFELVIKNGKLVSGPAVLQVHEGEQVTLHIRSDRSDELHLHGYDLHAQIKPGETVSLQLTANHTGRFGLELHKAHTELGALEVYPR
jgi:hypothetical protein